MALLEQAPAHGDRARPRRDTTWCRIPKAALDDLLAHQPVGRAGGLRAVLRRVRETNDQLRHQERMAQLGTLTAGVAHELNNPAAAVQGAADQLAAELDRLTAALARLAASPAVLDAAATRWPGGRRGRSQPGPDQRRGVARSRTGSPTARFRSRGRWRRAWSRRASTSAS